MTSPRPPLIVVSHRLPVEFDATENVWNSAPGGLVSAMAPVLSGRASTWVGWGGRAEEDPSAPAIPVWGDSTLAEVLIAAEDFPGYYEGMSNACLWPLYHDSIMPPAFHREDWRAYVRVNRAVAEAVCAAAPLGATVWVNDYQLQLVPRLIRHARPDLHVGFFLHIPFPAVELFLTMPWRREVLDGLLGANLIGFQTQTDAENFGRLCERLTGATVDADGLITGSDGHVARVGAFPISIDTPRWNEIGANPATMRAAEALRVDLGSPRYMLLGVDRMDYTKGIDVRLRAFGGLLEDGTLRAEDVALVQVATATRELVPGYQEIRDIVEREVGRINGMYADVGRPVIHYLRQSMDEDQLAALYLAADAALVTPLRDGMNLVAKEYIACRPDDRGALVLSEFSGAAKELLTAHQVNPYDVDGLKFAISAAVLGPSDDLRERMAAMRDTVRRFDVRRWSEHFLTTLEEIDVGA